VRNVGQSVTERGSPSAVMSRVGLQYVSVCGSGMTATCSGYLMPVGESQGHVREGSSLVGVRSRIGFFGYCIVRGLVVNKRPRSRSPSLVQAQAGKHSESNSWCSRCPALPYCTVAVVPRSDDGGQDDAEIKRFPRQMKKRIEADRRMTRSESRTGPRGLLRCKVGRCVVKVVMVVGRLQKQSMSVPGDP
jgi:hypothetical protein